MLNNCSRGDPTDICIGEIGRYLLVLSHALGNGKRLLSSGQIVDDLKTRLGELSKHFKSPQIPVDTREAMNRCLSQVKKDLALFDDHKASPKDLAEKYEWFGKRMYDFLFNHDPPTDFPGISCELQNLKYLVEAYNPDSPLVTLLATWMASSMTILSINHNDILSAQEHSHIHIYAGVATKFLDNIGSSSQTECLKRLDETIQFFKVQEEYANVNRPTSQSLDALEEFIDVAADLCTAIEKSLDERGDYCCSYSLDHIMSLSERVRKMLYSAGQSLFSDEDKHEVEQAFRKSVEILADATKSEFWDDFADLTKALCVIGECSETLQEAELSLCRLSPGRVALADRGGSGNSPLDSDARKKDDNPEPPARENMDKRVKAELSESDELLEAKITIKESNFNSACGIYALLNDLKTYEEVNLNNPKKSYSHRTPRLARAKLRDLDLAGYADLAGAIEAVKGKAGYCAIGKKVGDRMIFLQ